MDTEAVELLSEENKSLLQRNVSQLLVVQMKSLEQIINSAISR